MWRREAIGNWVIMIGPAVVGILLTPIMVFAIQNPNGFIAATAVLILCLFGIGFALFLLAKLSLFRQGISISFGSARMSPWFRRMYRAGYCLMGLGLVLALALVIAKEFGGAQGSRARSMLGAGGWTLPLLDPRGRPWHDLMPRRGWECAEPRIS